MKYLLSFCIMLAACNNSSQPATEQSTTTNVQQTDSLPLSYDALKSTTQDMSDSMKDVLLKSLSKLVYPNAKFKSDTSDFSDIREAGALHKSFVNLHSAILKNSDTANYDLDTYQKVYDLLEAQLVRRTEAKPKPSIDIKEMLMIAKVKSDINSALAQIKQKARQ